MADALAGGPPLDRLMLQVGGGALASACIESLTEAVALGALPPAPRFDTVQTEGAWPLRRAFDRVAARLPGEPTAADRHDALAYAATHRSAFMWPWEEEPHSIAHGILDDETYDWLAVVEGMLATGGGPVVVSEDILARANELARQSTGIDVDETGSSGLAGLLALREQRSDRGSRAGGRPLHRGSPVARSVTPAWRALPRASHPRRPSGCAAASR